MKKLIFLIFTIICGIILYTCASPLMVDGLPSDIYYSSKPIINGTTATYLAVNVSSTSIQVGFSDGNNMGTNPEIVTVNDVENGNAISGTYPNISFQNGLISGTIRFISDEQIKISFQQRIYPYTKMWDVVCETRTP